MYFMISFVLYEIETTCSNTLLVKGVKFLIFVANQAENFLKFIPPCKWPENPDKLRSWKHRRKVLTSRKKYCPTH